MQTWIPNTKVEFSLNSVAWYLSVCLFLYFLFPYILCFIRNFRGGKRYILLIVAIYFAQIGISIFVSNLNIDSSNFYQFEKWLTYAFPIYRTGDFFIGCIIGCIFLNTDVLKKASDKLISILEFLVIIIIVVSKYIYDNQIGVWGSEWCRYSLLFLPSSILVVYLFALNKGTCVKILSNKALISLGNISPYTFLIHQLVIRYYNIFIKYVGMEYLGGILKYTVCLVVTIWISLFWIKICHKVPRHKC